MRDPLGMPASGNSMTPRDAWKNEKWVLPASKAGPVVSRSQTVPKPPGKSTTGPMRAPPARAGRTGRGRAGGAEEPDGPEAAGEIDYRPHAGLAVQGGRHRDGQGGGHQPPGLQGLQ